MRFLRRLINVLLTILFGIVLALVLMEVGLRVFFQDVYPTEPAHDVLFLQPDRVVGWIHPPDFDFFWNGRNPYCIEFRNDISINNFGFRDDDWTLAKPPGTLRIAVIGDSFIEAVQVAQQETAVKRLEAQLRAIYPDRSIEVMNFGVSNYSVGQYRMVYDEYVRQFQPDYVVILAFYLQYNRTTQRDLSSQLQDFYTLNIRPTYDLDAEGNLVYLPAQDYDRYVAAVDDLIATHYGEDRAAEVFADDSPLYTVNLAFRLLSHTNRPPGVDTRDPNRDFPGVALNERIIQELNQEVQSDGGSLLFVDGFEYFERYGVPRGSGALVTHNQTFIESIGANYVDLSPALRASRTNPQYECDVHLNVTGNQLLANVLTTWFKDHTGW